MGCCPGLEVRVRSEVLQRLWKSKQLWQLADWITIISWGKTLCAFDYCVVKYVLWERPLGGGSGWRIHAAWWSALLTDASLFSHFSSLIQNGVCCWENAHQLVHLSAVQVSKGKPPPPRSHIRAIEVTAVSPHPSFISSSLSLSFPLALLPSFPHFPSSVGAEVSSDQSHWEAVHR